MSQHDLTNKKLYISIRIMYEYSRWNWANSERNHDLLINKRQYPLLLFLSYLSHSKLLQYRSVEQYD